MDVIQEKGPPVQLGKQALPAHVAQELVRPARIQLRAVNMCHGLTTPGRAKVYQGCQLIFLQPWLTKDVHRLPAWAEPCHRWIHASPWWALIPKSQAYDRFL